MSTNHIIHTRAQISTSTKQTHAYPDNPLRCIQCALLSPPVIALRQRSCAPAHRRANVPYSIPLCISWQSHTFVKHHAYTIVWSVFDLLNNFVYSCGIC